MTWSFTRASAVAPGMSSARRQWLARSSALQRSGAGGADLRVSQSACDFRGQGDFYLQSRGFDQRNRSVAKPTLAALIQLL
jgi:hypothetical protein